MAKQRELDFGEHTDFLALPTKELLEKYGKGSHIPGSGSAAALSALFGIEMMRTVCKLTLEKNTYRREHTEMKFILTQLEEKYKPHLISLFEQDIKVFHRLSMLRIERDRTEDSKQKEELQKKALNEQRIATEIPIQICETSLEILSLAIAVFDKGFKSARGDSGVAISNLLSSISGGLFIIFLNLKPFRKSEWLNKTRAKAEELARKFNNHQAIAFEKVLELYESLEESNKQLKFEIFTED
ncbi:MAG TPA: cyclodeaminase/cyclohydrolase family protein [Pyrinomonadaceae bacterium]|nr:cyclodeaminase/cyclohydrolase family protein [Pyrinomonadaceae bacterium]